VGHKVIKLREERELLGRFLIIQQSRPELVPKLEDTIREFEMSVVPRSLRALYIHAGKASLMHCIEAKPSSDLSSPPDTDPGMASVTDPGTAPVTDPCIPQVLIVDAMAVVQCMRKASSVKTLSDL